MNQLGGDGCYVLGVVCDTPLGDKVKLNLALFLNPCPILRPTYTPDLCEFTWG